MQMIYNVKDRPKFGQVIVFAIQQLLAIMAATLVVPVITGHGMSSAAALFGGNEGAQDDFFRDKAACGIVDRYDIGMFNAFERMMNGFLPRTAARCDRYGGGGACRKRFRGGTGILRDRDDDLIEPRTHHGAEAAL